LDAARGRALAAELGGPARFVAADVTDAGALAAAVNQATEAAPLRVAVACAGVATVSRVLARDGTPHDLDAFRTVIETNLVGTFNLLRLASAAMAANEPADDGERGLVVMTASVAAFEGQVGQAAYAASKGGVAGLTLPAARDLAPAGIRVVSIAPGTFDTPLFSGLPEAARQALAANVPFPRRLGHPSEYAALVLAVCQNRMLNGGTIRLDGALRMPPR
ncbi:MAG: SDR family oxidoreductase, partial [Acidimicrobiales bacterium]